MTDDDTAAIMASIFKGTGDAYAILRQSQDMWGAKHELISILRKVAKDIEMRQISPDGVVNEEARILDGGAP